ncbi:MAG: glycosyltransferase family 2 protein [Ornithinimicrobium sp.]
MTVSRGAPDGGAGSSGAGDAALVIPVYNEAAVVGHVVRGARAEFTVVVCVDDGSSDDSAQRARQAGAVVLRHPVNLGQGAALQTGISHLVADAPRGIHGDTLHYDHINYVVTFDADGQHRAADARDMVQHAKDHGLAIVFGSRFLDDRTRPGALRRMVLKTAVWITNQQTGMRLTDAHNGLRVIRRDAARRLDLRQNRMAHATEIVLQLGRTRLPWGEYGVHVLYTDYSRAKGQSLVNSVNVLIDSILK